MYCEKKKESQKTKRRKEEEKILGEEYTQLIPVTMLTVRNLGRLNKEVVQDTYDYWKKKRLAAGRPLIGRLQIEEEEIRHSSSYVRPSHLSSCHTDFGVPFSPLHSCLP